MRIRKYMIIGCALDCRISLARLFSYILDWLAFMDHTERDRAGEPDADDENNGPK